MEKKERRRAMWFERFQQIMSYVLLVVVQIYGLAGLIIILWKKLKNEIKK